MVFSYSCTPRDDEKIAAETQKIDASEALARRGDSCNSTQPIVDPDPPVRDGDNWRSSSNR